MLYADSVAQCLPDLVVFRPNMSKDHSRSTPLVMLMTNDVSMSLPYGNVEGVCVGPLGMIPEPLSRERLVSGDTSFPNHCLWGCGSLDVISVNS